VHTYNVDDLNGQVADECVEIGLDGRVYSIDLTAANAEQLRTGLAPFVAAARRPARTPAARRARRVRAGAPQRDPAQNQAVREWARRNGHKIADRGRIPAPIQQAYDDAHAG
jgi:hypothetical protein